MTVITFFQSIIVKENWLFCSISTDRTMKVMVFSDHNRTYQKNYHRQPSQLQLRCRILVKLLIYQFTGKTCLTGR